MCLGIYKSRMSSRKLINRREFLRLCGFGSILAFNKFIPSPTSDLTKDISSPISDKANILILVLDSLAANEMSLYGHTNETTPWLKELASKSIVYHNHYTPANFTSPATASLLTGTYPWTHRCFHSHGSIEKSFLTKNLFQLASATHTTVSGTQNILANILLNQFRPYISQYIETFRFALSGHFLAELFPKDYTSALWSEILAFSWIRKMPASLIYSLLMKVDNYANLQKDAQKFGDLYPRGIPNNYEGMTLTLEQALKATGEELASRQSPYLGYFHYWPPHSPYNPTKEFIGIFDNQKVPVQKPDHFFADGSTFDHLVTHRKHYNEFIANADAELGKQILKWQETGLLSNTILVITSDHGEMNERGIQGHSTRVLYNPLIKIPLLIMLPGQQSRLDIYENTSAIDILPTIMNWIGQAIPEWAEGEILPPFREHTGEPRKIFALEAQLNSKWRALETYTAVLIQEKRKLIFYKGYDHFSDKVELYDLNVDPEEMNDLSTQFPELASAMKRELLEKINLTNQPYLT